MLKTLQTHSSFNPFVIFSTLLLVILLICATILIPASTQAVLDWAKLAIFEHFSWFYILAFSVFLCFLLILSLSRFGNIKLGSNEETPSSHFYHGWQCFSLQEWALV